MSRFSVRMLACAFFLACLCRIPGALAATVTFEDAGQSGVYPALAAGYGGFDWSYGAGILALNHTELGFPDTGYERGAVSGQYVAYNNSGAAETRIRWAGSGSFDLISAFWTSAWLPASHSITLHGLGNGISLYSPLTVSISNTAARFVELNWYGIDELVIINNNLSSQWVLDDFSFQPTPATAVPEPSTWLLLLAGLLLISIGKRPARDCCDNGR